jgi:hypothetical protein
MRKDFRVSSLVSNGLVLQSVNDSTHSIILIIALARKLVIALWRVNRHAKIARRIALCDGSCLSRHASRH